MNVARRFGANLVHCRNRAGMSQERLGECADLHRTAIGLLEKGARVPRIDTLLKLATALHVAPDDLLDGIVWQPGTVSHGRFELR